MATHVISSSPQGRDEIRRSAVAGRFYPAASDTLETDVKSLLEKAGTESSANVQAVIVPIASKKEGVLEACRALKEKLEAAGVRVALDESENSPGWKFNEWEMKGVPVRIELGPRDLEAGKCLMARRDTLEKGEYALDSAVESVQKLLGEISENMYNAAKARMDSRIVRANSLDELLAGVESGNFVHAGWCGCRECEDKVKEFAQATARVMEDENTSDTCIVCGKKAEKTVIFARAY